MRLLTMTGLLIAGLIHLLALAGVVGGERLAQLYGLPFDEPNLQLLMRHRAVLFGLVGAVLVAGAFVPSLRMAAFIAGFVSVVAFLLLAMPSNGLNAALQRVVGADWIALAALVVAAGAELGARRWA